MKEWICLRTLKMDNGDVCFTEGKSYKVEWNNGFEASLIDDAGDSHMVSRSRGHHKATGEDFWVAFRKPYVAKLVTASIMVRVLVEDDSSEELIVAAAKAKMKQTIEDGLGENIESIVNDTECPYDPDTDGY